jgi:hypothetical protein
MSSMPWVCLYIESTTGYMLVLTIRFEFTISRALGSPWPREACHPGALEHVNPRNKMRGPPILVFGPEMEIRG